MKERNTHFKKKYQKVQKSNDFFGYVVNPGAKSSITLAHKRELSLINLQMLSIPSSFTLEKTYNTQGPIVDIIAGSNLNFVKLSYLSKLITLAIKTNDLVYSHETLKDTVMYRNTDNLCFSLNMDLQNKLVDFGLLFFLLKEANCSQIEWDLKKFNHI